MVKLSNGGEVTWRCSDCGYVSKKKTNLQEHIEAKHIEQAGVLCTICQLYCVNRKALRNHTYRYHRS